MANTRKKINGKIRGILLCILLFTTAKMLGAMRIYREREKDFHNQRQLFYEVLPSLLGQLIKCRNQSRLTGGPAPEPEVSATCLRCTEPPPPGK